MEQPKKVKVEIVGRENKGKSYDKLFGRVSSVFIKIKLIVAILLDAVDLVLGNIPILNTIWDFITFSILFIILRNKYLAFLSLTELVLPGIPILGQIDAIIPVATLTTLLDIGIEKLGRPRRRYNYAEPRMKKVN